MTHPQEPTRAPRAVTYARANQGVDRYRHPVHRPDRRRVVGPSPRPATRMLNRRRFWVFTVVLALAFVLGAATLNAVLAGPPTALGKDPSPPAGGKGEPDDRITAEPEERPHEPDERRGEEKRAPGEGRSGAQPDPRRGGPRDGAGGPAAPAPGSEGAGAPPDPTGHAPAYPPSGGRTPGGGDGPEDGDPDGGRPGGGDVDTGGAEPGADPDVYYANCNKARKAGAAPLYRGEPGYRERLDPDGDGVACD